jgi:hypothetical protein
MLWEVGTREVGEGRREVVVVVVAFGFAFVVVVDDGCVCW